MHRHHRIFLVGVLAVTILVGLSTLALDPFSSQQWYLDRVHAPEAWTITQGNRSVIVAVLDTGVDTDHPDLVHAIWTNTKEVPGDGRDNDGNGFIDDIHGWNFLSQDPSPQPAVKRGTLASSASHGTVIAGIIAAAHDNDFGIRGIAGKATIMPLVVLDTEGEGSSGPVAEAIDYAIAQGASIINLSFSGPENDPVLLAAIKRAHERNVIVVAAAGNASPGVDFGTQPMYPICYDATSPTQFIIGVAASDQRDGIASFTNYGAGCIDVVAPGTTIVSDVFQDAASPDFQDFIRLQNDGSSFSAAIVTGSLALMKSVNPGLTTASALAYLQATSTSMNVLPIYQGKVGTGLVNAFAAVSAAQSATFSTAGLKTSLMVSPGLGNGDGVQVYAATGLTKSFSVFGTESKGVSLATGPTIDNQRSIVVGAGKDAIPFVRRLTPEGILLQSFLAFPATYRGGVRVVSGDVRDTMGNEFIVAPMDTQRPRINIFSAQGTLEKEIVPYDATVKGPISIAVGNVTGDARPEIIMGSPAGVAPEVRIYAGDGRLLKSFPVFVPLFRGGVTVAVAEHTRLGQPLIVVGAGMGGGPHVMAFSAEGVKSSSFFVGPLTFRGGVQVSTGDIDTDGFDEVITTPIQADTAIMRAWSIGGQNLAEIGLGPISGTSGAFIIVAP